jgi:hypothetical protein
MRAEGTAVDFVASAVRNLLRLVDWLPFGFAAGVASILLSARNQRLGDLAAGTIVVVERPHRASPPAPIQGTQAMDHWDVSGISPRDIATVQSFLDRRGVLTERARAERAWELDARLRPKVAGAPPNLDAERFLEMLVAAKAARS